MYGGDSTGWGCLIILALMGVTFGVWKLVELIVWFCGHIHWS